MPHVSIILPVYHEEGNIEKVVNGIVNYVTYPYEMLLVFDDKKDPTIQIAEKLKKRYKVIRILHNKYPRGIVNALKTGFEEAKGDIIVITMADLSDNPKDINKLIKKIDSGVDVVSATRYKGVGKRIGGPVVKGFLSFFACKLLQVFTRIPTTDATNAFRAFRKDVLKNMTIESVGGFELPLEITVKAYANGAKISEVQTVWRERASGKSKFKLFQWLPHYLRWFLFALVHKP